MDKKKRLSIFLILTLALLLALGTIAYYTKTFSSDNNKVRAARFEVDSNGTLDGNEKFDLSDNPIYPGIDEDIYEFEIDKKNTEVPVKYFITVTPYDELFEPVAEGDSPVNVTVLRKVGEDWVDIGGLDEVEIIPDEVVEKFKIHMKWEHSDYDIEYQGKPGKVMINVVATQIDGELEGDNKLVEAVFLEYPYLKNFGYVRIQVRDIEGAAKYRVQFFYNDEHEGRVPEWTEIMNIEGDDYKSNTIFYLPGDKVNIEIYAEDGETLLHTFSDVKLTRQ